MLTWLLIGSAVYLLTCYVPALMLISHISIGRFLASRDEEPLKNAVHGRAERAARNFRENYPVFMGLGILALVVPGTNMPLAIFGAAVFVLVRIPYLPMYMAAIPVWRSMVFMVGWTGMVLMGVALVWPA
ncbi:MAPEG family protein [Pseudoroseicyclus sp. H15]